MERLNMEGVHVETHVITNGVDSTIDVRPLAEIRETLAETKTQVARGPSEANKIGYAIWNMGGRKEILSAVEVYQF